MNFMSRSFFHFHGFEVRFVYTTAEISVPPPANSFRLLFRFAMNVVCLPAKVRLRARQEVQ
jgi:hypothetical protein